MKDIEFAAELRRLQAPLNSGMGLCVARDIATYLEKGYPDHAKRIALHDHDKINTQVSIFRFIQAHWGHDFFGYDIDDEGHIRPKRR